MSRYVSPRSLISRLGRAMTRPTEASIQSEGTRDLEPPGGAQSCLCVLHCPGARQWQLLEHVPCRDTFQSSSPVQHGELRDAAHPLLTSTHGLNIHCFPAGADTWHAVSHIDPGRRLLSPLRRRLRLLAGHGRRCRTFQNTLDFDDIKYAVPHYDACERLLPVWRPLVIFENDGSRGYICF
ncbi:hypothetical protein FA95DRAFT_495449 [Auriscalpium vulgare]|uniref:Uncharacterized protein n=1 Tax=Auriscalpium vulgare TaxID=40419 RepID=A0ACB8S436_9AGAM|nr:hypothetical protein FA95DRAFT_495449 [Auriscalpium vulgare]